MLGVGLDSSISLVVATLDLQLVKSITSAMNAVNANGKCCDKAIDGVPVSHTRDCFERRPVIEPTLRINPRKVYNPTPRIEPRRVFHPTPRIDTRNNTPSALPPTTEPAPCEKTKSPLLPPWKTLPCEVKEPAPVQIKMIVQRPDIHHKGSLIDLFI